jgi:hypothetical protein
LNEIKKQITEVSSGVAWRVENCQTMSGIKDSYTQHWIETLINQSHALHKSRPGASIDETKAELGDWIVSQSKFMYNLFLELDSKGQLHLLTPKCV